MDQHAHHVDRANPADTRRCPACEYDLHGNTSGRCPECGAIILSAARSRLPWHYQQARGGITAYVQTVALLLFRPRQLAAETQQRVQRQPARRFHHESIALATFIAAGLFAILFLVRPARLEPLLNPPPDSLFRHTHGLLLWIPVTFLSEKLPLPIPIPGALLRLPILVWTDRLLILIPVLPALYLSLRIIAWTYRAFFRLGTVAPRNFELRRAARLAYYGSGLAPVIVFLIGLIALLHTFQSDEWGWAFGRWSILLRCLWLLLLLATPVVFYYPTLTLLSLASKSARRHIAAMIFLFPLLCYLITLTVTFASFWILGYIVIAIWSMTH